MVEAMWEVIALVFWVGVGIAGVVLVIARLHLQIDNILRTWTEVSNDH